MTVNESIVNAFKAKNVLISKLSECLPRVATDDDLKEIVTLTDAVNAAEKAMFEAMEQNKSSDETPSPAAPIAATDGYMAQLIAWYVKVVDAMYNCFQTKNAVINNVLANATMTAANHNLVQKLMSNEHDSVLEYNKLMNEKPKK